MNTSDKLYLLYKASCCPTDQELSPNITYQDQYASKVMLEEAAASRVNAEKSIITCIPFFEDEAKTSIARTPRT